MNTRPGGLFGLRDAEIEKLDTHSGTDSECPPWQVQDQVVAFERAGIDLLLLQCSPQLEEMERFAETVIAPLRTRAA